MRSRMWSFSASTALAAVLLLAACDSATVPDETVTRSEADDIAAFLSDAEDLAGVAMALEGAQGTRSFTRTTDCPAGGSVSVSGTGESDRDRDTRIVSRTWSVTQIHDNCAMIRVRRGEEVTATINGHVEVTGSSSIQLPEDRSGDRTLLAFTSRRTGSTTITMGDRTRTCVVDVTRTYDADTETFRMQGVVCGREVNHTR
jgi:hypothetical protein